MVNIRQTLIQRKIKPNKYREAIYDYLQNTKTHPTAEMIYKKLVDRFPHISPATIYNNLNLLCEHGVIKTINPRDRIQHFDVNLARHDHFICDACETILDIEKEVSEIPIFIDGHQIETVELFYRGVCSKCRNKKSF